MGILTVGVVTKPFHFEGARRMRLAESGITELTKAVDTLIVIPNQNLFRIANEKTTFADAFAMADQVLYSGVASITDLMVKQGLVNLDFADVRSIMREMGKAMMGTGEASGDNRAILAAEAAIANPLLDEVSMKGARGLLISITGGSDLTLYEVDEAASRIRQEVDEDANIILGATFDDALTGFIRVSVVATGIDHPLNARELNATEDRLAEVAQRLRANTAPRQPEQVRQQQPMMTEAPVAQPVAQPVAYEPAPTYAPQAPAPMQAPPAWAPAQDARSLGYGEPQPAPEQYQQHFIPPMPELPIRPPRMPTIDELPVPGQNQLPGRSQRRFAGSASHARLSCETLRIL
jgi:cell division protein FtsZ